ncbi:MAG: hypothetical protein CMB80_00725, partial [Flammeovirgaceae bacterium]|nr:hypothetical protein [Flammeovirgaceae bacterium]
MADTVLAMLEPGEYVIKKSAAKKIGYKNLNKMNRGGKMPKAKYSSYQKGGKVKKKSTSPGPHGAYSMTRIFTRKEPKLERAEFTERKVLPREFRKTLEGKAPDLDNDLWERYIKGGDLVLSSLKDEQGKRDKLAKAKGKASKMRAAGYKLPPGLKKGGKVKEKRKGDRVYEEDYDKFGP